MLIVVQLFAFVVAYDLYDYNGIVATGQSLSVGGNGNDNLTTTQPFGNLKLSLGESGNSWPINVDDPHLSLVPLTEPIRELTNGNSYPNNIDGETPASAMANHLSSVYDSFTQIHSCVGEGGQPMSVIMKGATETEDSGLNNVYFY
jgi:hypothetical protein